MAAGSYALTVCLPGLATYYSIVKAENVLKQHLFILYRVSAHQMLQLSVCRRHETVL
jgi:hypothetical protein